MKLVTASQMRELERRTMRDEEVPGEELMERAGMGVADAVMHLAELAGFDRPAVCLLAGRGNNGGDAFAAARFLKADGIDAEVWLAAAANEIRGDALKHLSRMRAAGVELLELTTMEDWSDDPPAGRIDLVVDGVLGIGLSGPARGPAAGAIHMINLLAREALVVSIDVPSGLDADSGEARGEAVKADLTVTIGLPKTGLARPEAREYVGGIEVIDIGLSAEGLRRLGDGEELITAPDIREILPARPRHSHKGCFGHVLLVGGSKGMAGAMILAARAAVRSGCGLTTVAVPRSIAPVVAGAVPEAMVYGLDQTAAGALDPAGLARLEGLCEGCDVLAMGPGMTAAPVTRKIVEALAKAFTGPVVLDADAVNVFAGDPGALKGLGRTLALTPHPGELARLLGTSASEVQKNRAAAAGRIATESGAVVILKGAGTLVARPGGLPPHINPTGNPGMATGGMGDILTGMLGALLAQGLETFDAARAAVWLHGRAGDQAAWRASQAGLHAGALIDEIPYVFRAVSVR